MAENARVLWASYKAHLEDRGSWTDATGKTLDRLIRATVEYEHYHPIAVCEGPEKTSNAGGQFVSLLWCQVQKLSDQIGKLEKALLLNPDSGGNSGKRLRNTKPCAADKFLNNRLSKH